MVMSPTFAGENYGGINLSIADDSGLGLVDFAIFPHLDHEKFPENSLANAEAWAAKLPVPTYAIDDQTAIRVVEGSVDVISEGHWKLFKS
jgi:dipeptidase E